jgi:hypothetical protein
MTDKLRQAEEEPYNGWVLRNVYFEDGEPLMHSEPEIERLQEREWVGLTVEDMEGMFLNAEGIRIARYIEARLKELNK